MGISGKRERGAGDKQSFWSAHIRAQEKSGLTIAEYCRRRGLARHRFHYWKDKLLGGKPRSGSISLVQVGRIDLCGGGGGYNLRVRLKSGHEIELKDDFTASALSRLLSVMEGA